ncbi:MAG: hypothetical protein AB7E47_01170 [Desulfovibrionaceae bacterium]
MRTQATHAFARSSLLLLLLVAALAASVTYARLLLAPPPANEAAPPHAPAKAPPPPVTARHYAAQRREILRTIEAHILAKDYAAAQRLFEQYGPTAAKDVVFTAMLADFEKKKAAAREEALLAETARLSRGDADKGVEIYAALAALAPDNAAYAERLAHYRRVRAQADLRRMDAYLADPNRTLADHAAMRDLLRRMRADAPGDPRVAVAAQSLARDALLFPQGNGRLEIALEDEGAADGAHALYIWIYNVGAAPLDLAAMSASLETIANATVAASANTLPHTLLAPGTHAHGRFTFPNATTPVGVTVSHPDAGTVSRRIN